MQLCNIQDTHFLNQISFNPLLLVSIEVLLLNLKFCCFHELPCSRNCFLRITLMAGLGVWEGRQGGRARVTYFVLWTHLCLFVQSHFLTITIKLPSHFLPPRLPSVRFPSDSSHWARPVVWVRHSLSKVETKSSRSSMWDGSICGWENLGMADPHVWYSFPSEFR